MLIGRQLGVALSEIEDELAKLPQGRTPTAKDWRAISASIRDQLHRKIAQLTRTGAKLDGCIGCGCLSLRCKLYNVEDKAAESGAGPRFVLGIEVDPYGMAYAMDIVRSSGSRELDREALVAARGWRFRPALPDGQPVGAMVEVPIPFDPRN